MNVKFIASISIFIILLAASLVFAQTQSHPLSQVSPIDANLNMQTYNISNINYVLYNTGIIAGGTRGIPTADIQSSAVTGSKIASNTIDTDKFVNPLAGPLNIAGNVNASAFYDRENSNYFADLASTGYSLLVAGSVGIGTTSPVKKLDVIGDINATSNVYGTTGLCIGTDCRTSWPSAGISGSGTVGYISMWNGSSSLNSSVIYQSAGNVGIGTTDPAGYKLRVAGTVRGSSFTDEENTGYYVDPASTSNVNGLTGAGTFSWNGVQIQGTAGRNYFYDSESTGLKLRVGVAWGKSGIYAENGDVVVGASTGKVSIQSDAAYFSNGNLYAPIYYDKDNTAYYLDPASNSVMNTINSGTPITSANIGSQSVNYATTAGGVSCPSGFTNMGTYCIQTDEANSGNALSWWAAADYCYDNYAGHLCSSSEWYIACVNNKLTNAIDDYEWVDAWCRDEVDPLILGGGSCTNKICFPADWNYNFRCCKW